MVSFSKYLVVVLSLGFASLASSSSEDYRSSSAAAFRLASAHSRVGDMATACARLSQSLEHYRSALMNETGVPEAALSGIYDDSDGMAEIRAKFGCKRS
ncbi:MAG TPA: hypothetical protein VFB93_06330 [Burkholderiales bacterium]|nr:hypothetical protein [Burkholderiales bacterium]